MTIYHISPELGPKPCSAKPGNCQFGTSENHYQDLDSANKKYEEILEKSNFLIPNLRKETNKRELIEKMTYEEILNFSNNSEGNFNLINKIIDDRALEVNILLNDLNKISPENPNNKITCDKATLKNLKKNIEDFKDKTAELVESYTESKFYKAKTLDISSKKNIGNLVRQTSFKSNTENWYSLRLNSIGGSDVGILAEYDFIPKEEQPFYVKLQKNRMEKSKKELPTNEEIAKKHYMFNISKRGRVYRGTVWEPRIRDQFAEDHPELRVYHTKAQYINNKLKWQQINIDGLISDRKDGKPNGILEIKTESKEENWKDGVPIKYKAQVLYYLKASGFKFAEIRVLINDNLTKDFRINSDDEIAPGTGITMDSYISSRVIPWWEDIKKEN